MGPKGHLRTVCTSISLSSSVCTNDGSDSGLGDSRRYVTDAVDVDPRGACDARLGTGVVVGEEARARYRCRCRCRYRLTVPVPCWPVTVV